MVLGYGIGLETMVWMTDGVPLNTLYDGTSTSTPVQLLDPIRFHQFDVIIRHSTYVTVALE